jgi:PTS system fructose-specific IIC component
VLAVGVAEGIRHPEQLIERVQDAPVHRAQGSAGSAGTDGGGTAGPAPGAKGASGKGGGQGRGVTYKALMNGVSCMIPSVVVGGLLIAVSLALGGDATATGYAIPEGPSGRTSSRSARSASS